MQLCLASSSFWLPSSRRGALHLRLPTRIGPLVKEFHADDAFQDWEDYTCPNCGGYREPSCSTCATYIKFYKEVVHEVVSAPGYDVLANTIQAIHDEVLLRMETS